MNRPFDIEERKPIWIALSDFYLDTELSDSDLRHIAFTILDSPYNLEEVKSINKYEIFPVLQANLLSIAGEWAGFDEKWLIKTITNSINNRSRLSNWGIEINYLLGKWMFNKYWKKIEEIYNEISSNPDSFIVICRKLWKQGIEPFDFDNFHLENVEKLKTIALGYKQDDKISELYALLHEGQYWMNIWAAYFLLEYFEIDKNYKRSDIDNELSVVDYCLMKITSNLPFLKKESLQKQCREWIEKKKNEIQLKLW